MALLQPAYCCHLSPCQQFKLYEIVLNVAKLNYYYCHLKMYNVGFEIPFYIAVFSRDCERYFCGVLTYMQCWCVVTQGVGVQGMQECL